MNAETESREVWAEGMLAKILRPAAKKKNIWKKTKVWIIL